MPPTQLFIDRILVQKDEFLKRDGTEFGERGFWESNDKEAVVNAFKRVRIEGHVSRGDERGPFEIQLDTRGHLMHVYATKCIVGPEILLQTLVKIAGKYRGSRPWFIIVRRDGPIMTLGIDDPMWWAGILHDKLKPSGAKQNEPEDVPTDITSANQYYPGFVSGRGT